MLIRPPQLQFFKHNTKNTATDTYYQIKEIKVTTIYIKEVYKY